MIVRFDVALFASTLVFAAAACSDATTSVPSPPTGRNATVHVHVALPRIDAHIKLRHSRYVSAASKSIGLTVQPDGGRSGQPTFANCSTVCDVTASAPTGTAAVVATLYDGLLGAGHALSIGSAALAVAPGDNDISLVFDGVFARGVINLSGAVPVIGTTSSIGGAFFGEDADANRIVGPGTYASSSGAPLTVVLSNSDKSAHSHLNPTAVTSPTNVTLSFDGHATAGIVTQRSAAGASSAPFVTYLPKERQLTPREPWPHSVGIGSDGNVWFTVPGAVGRRNADGSFTLFRAPGNPTFNDASELAPAADGAFWLAATVNSTPKFERVTTSGTFTPYPLPFGFEGTIEDSVVGADGAVWFLVEPIGNQTANQLGRIDTGGNVTLYRINSFYSLAFNLVVGPDKQLWFYLFDDAGGKAILRFANGQFSGYAPPAGAPPFFTGPDRSFWFPFADGNSLVKMDTNGHIFTTIALPPCPVWNLRGTRSFGAVSTDGEGDVWFADIAANAIGRFQHNQLLEYPIFPGSSFPRSVAAAPDGKVYYADFGTSGPGGNHGGGLGTIDPSLW